MRMVSAILTPDKKVIVVQGGVGAQACSNVISFLHNPTLGLMARVLVCVAWPYANSAIHLGHVAGSLLSPDIFTKFHRMKGDEVLMVSGSDQHGTPVTVRAEREGLSVQEVAEKFHAINKRAIEGLGIEFSLFTKTHTENHFQVVHDLFLKLLDEGFLYKKRTLQYYCDKCAKFLPDRYVEGICPECGNEKARGDQCESCGKTFEAGELRSAFCTHCRMEPTLKETEHFFFKLSDFQQSLIGYVEDKNYWKPNVQLFTQNWLEAGLQDRAITRDMNWGVSVPLQGWEGKVIYVWFEAVIGYLSASKEWAKLIGDPDAWKPFWTDPKVKGYYFLGKDNIPFHTIFWPAMLMGYGGLNLPYDVPANEFLTFKGEKLSKSRGVSIDIPAMLQRFDSDAIRYYLTVNMPEGRDSDFDWDDFVAKVNNELVATLGNYYHRVLSFTHRHFGQIPEFRGSEEERGKVEEEIAKAKAEVEDCLTNCQFKKGLKAVMDLAQFGNRFFDGVAPWALIKTDRERCGSVLNLNLELVRALSILSYPFVPRSAQEVWALLGFEKEIRDLGWNSSDSCLPPGQKLREPSPLFSKISLEEGNTMFNDFENLNLKVGEILSVSDHPNADQLILMEVDIGKKIQLVAGIKKYYSKESLLGKKVVVVSNLKPAKLRGYESQGMVLAAEHGESVKLLTPAGDASPGEKVNSGMVPSEEMLTFPDFQKLTLRVGEKVDKDKVDIGRIIRCKCPPQISTKKIVVFLPSSESSDALALFTEKGVQITVDGDLPNGASVR